jgi:molybdopterin converting factor small subunit
MRVEFYGVSRQRAGRADVDIRASTLGELLTILSAEMPALGELVDAGHLHPALAASLNGDRFVRDPQTPLADDDCVLLLSADAGG